MALQLVEDKTNPDASPITFEIFWRAYPKKVARKFALRAWVKVDPKHYPKILPAIAAQRKTDQWQQDGGKFIPFPASWLNGERWDDSLDEDLSMGECCWNRNGNRELGKPKCQMQGTTEKGGIVYCAHHAKLV